MLLRQADYLGNPPATVRSNAPEAGSSRQESEEQPETAAADKIGFHHRMMQTSIHPVVLRLTRYPEKGTMHLQMLNAYKAGELKTNSN